jgi:superfamily II DNA/RNA helicase
MGADGMAISFVTPEQGKVLSGIEAIINRLIPEDKVEGFEAFAPRIKVASGDAPKASSPVFGRRTKRYSNRL